MFKAHRGFIDKRGWIKAAGLEKSQQVGDKENQQYGA
jgi:hypothetical protein